MITITVAQFPTNSGVLLELTLSAAAPVIVYARDEDTGKIYDLKEVLSAQTKHHVALRIPSSHGSTKIVARAIQ